MFNQMWDFSKFLTPMRQDVEMRWSKGAAEVYFHIYFVSSFGLVLKTPDVRPGFSQSILVSYIGHFPFSQSLSRVRFCLSLHCSTFTAGLLLPFVSSLQHRAHCCPSLRYFSRWKGGWNESILPSFHHFTLPGVPLWSAVWQSYHLPLQHIIPAGSFQTCDQKEGVKILNSSHLANALRRPKRALAWDGGGGKKAWCVWQGKKRHYYSGLSALMVYFLENMQQNKNCVNRAIGGRRTFVWGLKCFPRCCFSQEAYIIDTASLVTNKHFFTGLCKQTQFCTNSEPNMHL